MRITGSPSWPTHPISKQLPRDPDKARTGFANGSVTVRPARAGDGKPIAATDRTSTAAAGTRVAGTEVTSPSAPHDRNLGTMAYAHAVMRSGRVPADLAPTLGPRHDRTFLWPAPGAPLPTRLTGYVRRGALAHRPHRGIDIMAPRGSPVIAPEDGVVLFARTGWNGGYGNSVVLLHADGSCTRFAHLGSIASLTPGARVERGAPIATVGNTGLSRGAHLHFEVWANGDWTSQRGRFAPSDLRAAGATDAVIDALR